MQHLKSDLGRLQAGSTVVVTLKQQANVLLMDASNYRTYSSGRGGRYTYYGGLAKRSRARIKVPRTGPWFLAVDLGGYAGTVAGGWLSSLRRVVRSRRSGSLRTSFAV